MSSPRYAQIGAILAEEIADTVQSVGWLSVGDLEDTPGNYQIVLGDTANGFIRDRLAALNVNTLDLGKEGFSLTAVPDPPNSCLILVAANDTTGVLRGAFALLGIIADETVENLRIRDYPDRPYREVFHWVP